MESDRFFFFSPLFSVFCHLGQINYDLSRLTDISRRAGSCFQHHRRRCALVPNRRHDGTCPVVASSADDRRIERLGTGYGPRGAVTPLVSHGGPSSVVVYLYSINHMRYRPPQSGPPRMLAELMCDALPRRRSCEDQQNKRSNTDGKVGRHACCGAAR